MDEVVRTLAITTFRHHGIEPNWPAELVADLNAIKLDGDNTIDAIRTALLRHGERNGIDWGQWFLKSRKNTCSKSCAKNS